jgi:hypothetical protein
MKYLGVTVDPKLNWSLNTRIATTRAKMAVGRLRRLCRRCLSQSQLRTLVFHKVLPLFTYGLAATYPALKGGRLLLERLNRYACRTVLNDYKHPYTDLLSRLDWKPLSQLLCHRRCLLGSKYFSGKRYLPPGTVEQLLPNPRLRARFHNKALKLNFPTGLRISESSLEQIVANWNRLPQSFVDLSYDKLRLKLLDSNFCDVHDGVLADMFSAIRVL